MRSSYLKRVWLYSVTISPILLAVCAGVAAADSSTQPQFNQKILPLDCVFTIINSGTGELQYLTPKECGVVIPPPTNGNPQPSTPVTTQPVTPGSSRQVFFVQKAGGDLSGSNAGAASSLPWQPIATNATSSNKQPQPQNDTSPVTAQTIAVVGVSILVVMGLIVLL